jgi:lysophospholipase L1-like esterase
MQIRYTTPVLVLGHSFISHLKDKIEDPSSPIQFVHPVGIATRSAVSLFGIPGGDLHNLHNFLSKTQMLHHFLNSIVLLQIGGNDISKRYFNIDNFERELVALLDMFQAFGCRVVFMGIWRRLKPRGCTVDMYNDRRAKVHDLVRAANGRNGLWFYSARNTSNSIGNLDTDGVHPSPTGYLRLCNELSNALDWILHRVGSTE